jgi:CHASE2 domain-containing sensor protein
VPVGNMEKKVILTLSVQDIQQDIGVGLLILREDGAILGGNEGHLPPCPKLLDKCDNWQSNIRCLALPNTRIKIKTNTKGNIIENFYAKQKEQYYKDCYESELALSILINNWLQSESFRPIQDEMNKKISQDDLVRLIICSSNYQIKNLPWNYWNWLNENKRQAEIIRSHINTEPTSIIPSKKISFLVILGYLDDLGYNLYLLAIAKLLNDQCFRLLGFYFHTLIQQKLLSNSKNIDTNTDLHLLYKNLPKDEVELIPLIKPTIKEFTDSLWQEDIDIIYFAGHSETDAEGIGKIYINDNEYITIPDLKYALQAASNKRLKLTIFNSCDGLGLAQELEKLNIPNLILMRNILPDKVAHSFLNNLFKYFAIENNSLHLAELKARKQLQGLEKTFPSASSMPVIYQNLADKSVYWQDWVKKSKPFPWNEIFTLAGISLVVTSLIIGGRTLKILEPITTSTYDLLISQQVIYKTEDNHTLAVTINKDEVDTYAKSGTRCLKDEIIVKLIKNIYKYNPRAIGLDIFFDSCPLNKNVLELFKEKKNLITVFTIGGNKHEPIKLTNGVPDNQIGFADLEYDDDDDQTVRRQLLEADGYHAFSLLLAFHYLRAENVNLDRGPKDEFKFNKIILNKLDARNRGYSYLDGEHNQLLRNFRSNYPKNVSLTAILNDQVGINNIEDKVILIGKIDSSEPDEHKTPLGIKRGLFIHAQMVDEIINIAHNKLQQISFLSLWIEYSFIYTCSLLGGLIVYSFLSPIYKIITSVVIIFVLYLICLYLFTTQVILMPLGWSIITLVSTEVMFTFSGKWGILLLVRIQLQLQTLLQTESRYPN